MQKRIVHYHQLPPAHLRYKVCLFDQDAALKWHTEFGHLNRGDMLTSEQHRCSNEKKKF
ncbi:chromosome partitioning protein ParA [Shigella flexneri]|nr:chromosome partitioning protein ParA [Shigella flexneri]